MCVLGQPIRRQSLEASNNVERPITCRNQVSRFFRKQSSFSTYPYHVSPPTKIDDLQPHQNVFFCSKCPFESHFVHSKGPSHSSKSEGRETCVPSPSPCELAITWRIVHIDKEAQTLLAGAEADFEVVERCFALSPGQFSKLYHGNLVGIEKRPRNSTHSGLSIEKKPDGSVILEDIISPTPSLNSPDSADIKEPFRGSVTRTSLSAMPLSYQPVPISSPPTRCASIPTEHASHSSPPT